MNNIIGLTLITVLVLWLLIISYCKTKKINIWKDNRYIILIIYTVFLVFLAAKMYYYQFYVGEGLDEPAHIGYVAYLEKEDKIIPEFTEMHGLVRKNRKQNERKPEHDIEWRLPSTKTIEMKESLSINYLGHPPLYYHILKLTDGIKVNKDGTYTVILHRLRTWSSYFIIMSFIILFYMGYKMLPRNTMAHFMFAAVLVSIPNIAYGGSMVNNDSMAFFAVSLFLCGIYWILEGNRSFLTYLFLVVGGCLGFLSKLTSGLLILIIFLCVLFYFFFIKKDREIIFNKKVLVLMPLCILTISYFVYIYAKYGSVQASYQVIALEEYLRSPFAESNIGNNRYSLLAWLYHFVKDFFKTSVVIARFDDIEKLRFYEILFSVKHFMFSWIWVMPVVLISKRVRNKLGKLLPMYIATFMSFILTFLMHTISGYKGYVAYGRYGGANSRYYLSLVVVFVLLMVKLIDCLGKDKDKDKCAVYRIKDVIYLAIGMLAIYQDTIVYLLEHCILISR